MLGEEVAEPVDDRRREVPCEIRHEVLGIRQVRLQERSEHGTLRVRQQDGQLRARHADPVRPALRHLIGRRQELDVALQLALGLELLHQVFIGLDPLRGLLLLLREDLRLQVVVVEHVRHDVGGTRLEHAVPALEGELTPRDREPQQDLPVDLMVGGVDARGVVDEIRVDAPPGSGILDPSSLREPEIPTLTHDLRSEISPVDPQSVVRPITGIFVRLLRRLHVGADPTVPEQVDRGLQDPPDQLRRGHTGSRLGRDAQEGADLG